MNNSLCECLKYVLNDQSISNFEDTAEDLANQVEKVIKQHNLVLRFEYSLESTPKNHEVIICGKSALMKKVFAVSKDEKFIFVPSEEPLTEEFIVYFTKKL